MNCWRFPFYLQGLLTLPLALAICRIPASDLDITHRNKRKRRVRRALRRRQLSSRRLDNKTGFLEDLDEHDIEAIERAVKS